MTTATDRPDPRPERPTVPHAAPSPSTTAAAARHRQSGPPLGPPAVVSTALFVASLVVGTAATHGTAFVNPWAGGVGDLSAYAGAVRWTALLQFGSAVPLAIYACTASARLHRLGIRAPGATIALGGGLWSAVMLALSALTTFALSWTAPGEPAHVLRAFAFATGGVGMVVGLGLLIAGMSVPALIVGLLPRALSLVGLLIALVCELSFLALAVEPMSYLLPVGRFGGIVWLIVAGFWLPRERARRTVQA